MSRLTARNLVAFLVGFLFAVGLGIAQMTNPQKVIGFLSPFNWDPSLLFVMVGAVGVHAITYNLIRKRASPLLDSEWHVPNRHDISIRLVLGSMIFGIGWGLGGYCPGPALTSVFAGDVRAPLFVGAMLLGMILFRITERYLPSGK
jgi:uncharacterized membrane protein YedE/YeeE